MCANFGRITVESDLQEKGTDTNHLLQPNIEYLCQSLGKLI